MIAMANAIAVTTVGSTHQDTDKINTGLFWLRMLGVEMARDRWQSFEQ
jgi:hypothetical protein